MIYVYLKNQSARIIWNNAKGNYNNIDKGVRQGGILSPLLFKIHINELLDSFSKLDDGCRYGVSILNILSYAGDLAILVAQNRD